MERPDCLLLIREPSNASSHEAAQSAWDTSWIIILWIRLTPSPPISPICELGRLQVSDITFLAMPGTIGAENGRPIDGLLGGTLLSRFAVLLDYPHRTISWIYPGNLDDSTAAALGFDPKSVIGMTQEEHVGLGFKVNNYGTRVQLQSGQKQWGETLFFDTRRVRHFHFSRVGAAPGISLYRKSAV